MTRPNIYALPPGVDFAAELVRGLSERFGDDPAALARTELWVNTSRMRRRLWDVFDAGPARLLPRIRLVTELADPVGARAGPVIPPLRKRLELRQLVVQMIETAPGVAARSAAYDMADSLARLFTEMADEGVSADDLRALDTTDTSGHWERSLRFLGIAAPFAASPDANMRQRAVAEALIRQWRQQAPDHPIVLAGSTGSRGPVALLMQAVANLPQGAVVLPGFDFETPEPVWRAMEGEEGAEDHPQYRLMLAARRCGITAGQVRRWTDAAPPDLSRNRLISLALRPAPVTDGWMREGPLLGDVVRATENVTLIEAPSLRAEALAIALRLRKAAEDGLTAALVTPDRTLARRVTAALDRWGIRPDDSAGLALDKSAPGRLLLMVSSMLGSPVTSADLVALLSHPMVRTGAGRGEHLLHTRALELWLRKKAVPQPRKRLAEWAEGKDARIGWIAWLDPILAEIETVSTAPLANLAPLHIAMAEALVGDPARLWVGEDGTGARALCDRVLESSDAGGRMEPRDYHALFAALLADEQARDPVTPHPNVMIWGTLEARVQSVDLAILGGLNDGVWPHAPVADPWLSRPLRAAAGLLSPERQVGLSAHDFQQAIAAKKVVLSRAVRDDEALTVPSRWLNRLVNLLDGLGDNGKAALTAMRGRGQALIDIARELERPIASVPRAPRPSPCPPVSARPRQLSVTRIKTLVQDPYETYARHILRLEPLRPLRPDPDAMLRGILVHEAFEKFIDQTRGGPPDPSVLMAAVDEALASVSAWPAIQRFWRGIIAQNAEEIARQEVLRRRDAAPRLIEASGALEVSPDRAPPFTLTGKADRVDVADDGSLRIYDYKTGKVPTKADQQRADKQLPLLALIAEAGGFKGLDPARVSGAAFLGVGRTLTEVSADVSLPDVVMDEFRALLSAYGALETGYPARARITGRRFAGDYARLSRFGEWTDADQPVAIRVGRA